MEGEAFAGMTSVSWEAVVVCRALYPCGLLGVTRWVTSQLVDSVLAVLVQGRL